VPRGAREGAWGPWLPWLHRVVHREKSTWAVGEVLVAVVGEQETRGVGEVRT